jgi:hypothetical protein
MTAHDHGRRQHDAAAYAATGFEHHARPETHARRNPGASRRAQVALDADAMVRQDAGSDGQHPHGGAGCHYDPMRQAHMRADIDCRAQFDVMADLDAAPQ